MTESPDGQERPAPESTGGPVAGPAGTAGPVGTAGPAETASPGGAVGRTRELLGGMSRGRKITATVATCVFALFVLATVINASSPAASRPPSTPPLAKSFSLHALGRPGQAVSLSRYPGRPLIVNFFASWCHPCQKETPLLAGFYRAHHGQVTIVGVDVNDGTQLALGFVHRTGVGYTVAADPDGATAAQYGVVAVPQTFFLNADHRVVKRVFGAVTQAELTAGLARMK